jgi:hypothetical protein
MSNPIYIPTDDGHIFTLQPLSYRERIALAQKLLLSIADHRATPCHLVSDINRAVGTMHLASHHSLLLEKKPKP